MRTQQWGFFKLPSMLMRCRQNGLACSRALTSPDKIQFISIRQLTISLQLLLPSETVTKNVNTEVFAPSVFFSAYHFHIEQMRWLQVCLLMLFGSLGHLLLFFYDVENCFRAFLPVLLTNSLCIKYLTNTSLNMSWSMEKGRVVTYHNSFSSCINVVFFKKMHLVTGGRGVVPALRSFCF